MGIAAEILLGCVALALIGRDILTAIINYRLATYIPTDSVSKEVGIPLTPEDVGMAPDAEERAWGRQ